MIWLVLVGAAAGAVLFWLAVQLVPPKDSALTRLGRIDSVLAGTGTTGSSDLRPFRPAAGAGLQTLQTRLGAWLSGLLTRSGVSYTTLRQDLALTGQTFEATIGRKVVLFAGGFLGGLLILSMFAASGVAALPPGLPLGFALAFGVVLFFVPDLDARAAAKKRRKDFRRAFGAYLFLVALEMAGSAAPAEALPKAAAVGQGWPLALIRDTLYRASRSGTNQWEALTELGVRIGVAELRDLGQLVKLVAHDGAKVRQTLMSRATTMRRRELADAQGAAGERDQSMRLAQMVLALGFVVYLGFPAVVAILAI